VLGSPSDFIWGRGRLASAWPAGPDDNAYSRVRTSRVQTLIVNGDLDFATPPQNPTRRLLPYLPNGHEVVLKDMGHTDDFWQTQVPAGTHLVNTYLATGNVDASRYEAKPVDFTPSTSQGRLAEIVLAAMLGLAGAAALSLVWLGCRRGRIGRKTSFLVRSLLPVVLGLGGWFTGVIVALVALPATPIDSVALAVVSIGMPIGLGISWAWAGRDAPARGRTTGTVLALAGALAGSWFGFHAITGLFAVMTAIAGATAGANVVLIVLDMTWAPAAREPAAAGTDPLPTAA
jgi:hypothetical protein